jgi:hypothetical protein
MKAFFKKHWPKILFGLFALTFFLLALTGGGAIIEGTVLASFIVVKSILAVTGFIATQLGLSTSILGSTIGASIWTALSTVLCLSSIAAATNRGQRFLSKFFKGLMWNLKMKFRRAKLERASDGDAPPSSYVRKGVSYTEKGFQEPPLPTSKVKIDALPPLGETSWTDASRAPFLESSPAAVPTPGEAGASVASRPVSTTPPSLSVVRALGRTLASRSSSPSTTSTPISVAGSPSSIASLPVAGVDNIADPAAEAGMAGSVPTALAGRLNCGSDASEGDERPVQRDPLSAASDTTDNKDDDSKSTKSSRDSSTPPMMSRDKVPELEEILRAQMLYTTLNHGLSGRSHPLRDPVRGPAFKSDSPAGDRPARQSNKSENPANHADYCHHRQAKMVVRQKFSSAKPNEVNKFFQLTDKAERKRQYPDIYRRYYNYKKHLPATSGLFGVAERGRPAATRHAGRGVANKSAVTGDYGPEALQLSKEHYDGEPSSTLSSSTS